MGRDVAAIEIGSIEQALDLLRRLDEGTLTADEIGEIHLGEWVNSHVHLELGLHSEITAPYMEAFLNTQNSVYRLVALIKYGAADIRHLTQDDLEEFQVKVKVAEGSSDMVGKVSDAVSKMAELAVDKMTPEQLMITLLGFGVLISTTVGFKAYLNYKQKKRVAELRNEERKAELEAMQYATHEQAETARIAIEAMSKVGDIGTRAVSAAASVNAGMLKAASQTLESDIDGTHLHRVEARDLRTSARRPVTKMIVEREMRVVDINTSDPIQTTVIVEDGDGDQHRLVFADRLVEERDVQKLHESLRTRAPVWLRLDVKDVGGELRINEILRVVDAPDVARAANEGRQD